MAMAVISDIHGNLSALEAVLDDISRRGLDRIVNLGDCFSGPFDAAGTARRLAALDLPTVRGNHDRQLFDRPREEMGLWEDWVIDELSAADLDWLRGLPLTLRLEDILLCHATPGADDENWLDHRGPENRLVARDLSAVLERAGDTDATLMLCGHTHEARIVRLPEGRMIVNPGSVGCPAYLDTRMEPPFIHQTGTPDARYAIVEKRSGIWSADLIAVPYNASEMVALARARGADSWADAVTSGWFA